MDVGARSVGVDLKGIRNFTVLAGVLLSDVDTPNSGNLTLFPGSHLTIAQIIREEGGPGTKRR